MTSTFILISLLLLVWIFGAWATLKLDAVLTEKPTDLHLVSIFLVLISWPVGVVYLCTCKHRINNGSDDYWGI